MQSSASPEASLRLSSNPHRVDIEPCRFHALCHLLIAAARVDGEISSLQTRPFFKDSEIWQAAAQVKATCCRGLRHGGEAPAIVLAHELMRSSDAPPASALRGGLSGWQQRMVADHIEANLAEALRLTELALLVRLSPYHFARAFKQSFGIPPHRYHVGRRIERAKNLLADPSNSVTGIARALGFAETSSFSAAFRRVTGASPSDFRRARN